jgi:branched-subunit amino acid ABC-type transport system permease component
MNFVLKREGYSMNRNKIFGQIIAILGMMAALVVAYSLDRCLIQAREEAAETFILFPVLWEKLAANLIAAAILLLLAWFVFTRLQRSISLTIMFLIAGLGLMLYPLTGMVLDTPMFSLLARSPFREARAALVDVRSNSLTAFSSAFMVAIGLFNLIPRGKAGS